MEAQLRHSPQTYTCFQFSTQLPTRIKRHQFLHQCYSSQRPCTICTMEVQLTHSPQTCRYRTYLLSAHIYSLSYGTPPICSMEAHLFTQGKCISVMENQEKWGGGRQFSRRMLSTYCTKLASIRTTPYCIPYKA